MNDDVKVGIVAFIVVLITGLGFIGYFKDSGVVFRTILGIVVVLLAFFVIIKVLDNFITILELKNVTKEVEDEWNSQDKGRVEAESNKNSNGLEMQAKKVITIKDILKTWAEMEIIKNFMSFFIDTPIKIFMSFFIDTPKKNKEKRRLEKIEIEKLKVDITNRWIEIVKNNPGLTQSELKIVYEDVYPNDSELEQRVLVNYLRERENEISSKDIKKAQDIGDIKLILFIFLIIFIIGFLGTCIFSIASI